MTQAWSLANPGASAPVASEHVNRPASACCEDLALSGARTAESPFGGTGRGGRGGPPWALCGIVSPREALGGCGTQDCCGGGQCGIQTRAHTCFPVERHWAAGRVGAPRGRLGDSYSWGHLLASLPSLRPHLLHLKGSSCRDWKRPRSLGCPQAFNLGIWAVLCTHLHCAIAILWCSALGALRYP